MAQLRIWNVITVFFLFICSDAVLAQIRSQQNLNDLAAGLRVSWNVVTNTRTNKRYDAEVTLLNKAQNISLSSDPWQIHFSCGYKIEPCLLESLGDQEVELKGQDVNLTHVQGDHYFLEPTQSFIPLPPGFGRKIKLQIEGYSVARTDSLPNWYITYPGFEPTLLTDTVREELSFVEARDNIQQLKRFVYDEYNPFTTQDRYERNYVPDLSDSSDLRVVPKPVSVELNPNSNKNVAITGSWNITYDGQLDSEASYLNSSLRIQHVSPGKAGVNVIHLKLGNVIVNANGGIQDFADAYSLDVNATSQQIVIVGRGASGVFYGIITLLSLLDSQNQVPHSIVNDAPRFQYRGLMLDLVQNFQSKQEILDVIEMMSQYKLNKLHMRLSGDEGWRLEVPSLPELTKLGSQRCHDPSETKCLMPQLGSGPSKFSPSGSGYLSIVDYADIVEYAGQRHVTVIPEINMPGNSRAAILSMKLRNATDTNLVDPKDTSRYVSSQMFTDSVMNPCLNSTYNFISIVVDELIRIHNQSQQPLKNVHIGGDRVDDYAWIGSPECQQLLATGGVFNGSHRQYFLKRLADLAASKGLSLGTREDGVLDNKNMPLNLTSSIISNTVAYSWNSFWKTESLASTYNLANLGYKVILGHASHLYLDHTYEPDPEERGTYWATRYTDTKKLFSYNAVSYYDNAQTYNTGENINVTTYCAQSAAACPELTRQENIVGIEATLYTKTSRNREQLYQNLLPRLLAFAERAWHKATWELLPSGDGRNTQFNADWASFVRAVGYRELPKLTSDKIPFRIPPPGAIISFDRLLTTALYSGLVVEYSLDAGSTWKDAQAAEPVKDWNYRIWLRTRTDDSRYSRTVILYPGQQAQVTNQVVIDYISQYMNIKYTVVDNFKTYGDDLFVSSIQLSNSGNKTIPGGNWKIYFIAVNTPEPSFLLNGKEYVDYVSNITISHVKGYLYSLGPTLDFPGIAPGGNLQFTIRSSYWSVSRYEQMPRWYVSSPGTTAKDIVSTVGDDLAFVTPFTKPEQWKRFSNDKFDPWTPEVRYKRNADREVTPLTGPPIIPTPFSYTTNSQGKLNLTDGQWTVVYSNETLKNSGKQFIDLMKEFFPNIGLVLSPTATTQKVIRLQFGSIDSKRIDAYKITVQAASQIIDVYAATTDGAYYGAITLLQLALKSNPAGTIPDCQIEDWARLPYRGMHVDSARNFIPKPIVLKLLKVMSIYKLNRLHFHLADDEGWRLEIPGMQELTEFGGKRCHDVDETRCVMSTLGSGAGSNNVGSGFYTVEDYKEILTQAQNLHIQVIPEFDTPGHAHTAIRAMRVREARLKDIGNYEDSSRYVLDDDMDTSHYFSVQFYTDNAVNPCIESTYNFIKEVYTQVTKLHKDIQPLLVFHFGGDEVAQGAWVNSSACVSQRKSKVNLKSLFTQRVSNITSDIGLGAWEDGLMDHASVPWNRSLLANRDIIVQAWQNVWEWGVAARAYNLANNGYKVVFSPVTHMYFDHPQEPSPEERGFYWGTRYTDAYKAFSFMPDNYYMNADIKRSGESITLAEICGENNAGCPPLMKPENIYGLQGQLWAETIHAPEDFEYMAYPRLLSLAERAWHKGDWEGLELASRDPKLKSDWSRFSQNLGNNDLAILDRLSVGYRVPPPGAKQDKYNILAKVEFQGLKVQYSVGGSAWALLDGTQTFTAGQEVKLRTLSANGKRFSTEVKIVIANVSTSIGSQPSTSSVLILVFVVISIFYNVL